MFSHFRKQALSLALLGALAGTMATEVTLQNGTNNYEGCKDATISFGGPLTAPGKEYDHWGFADTDANYDSIPHLLANFCPS